MLNRRQFLTRTGLVAGAAAVGALPAFATSPKPPLLMRPIPRTGEMVPAIGMGTSGSFNVAPGTEEYAALPDVLEVFFSGGGTIIDTAPTYGRAEDTLGELLTNPQRERMFMATKLSGVTGWAEGRAQFTDTLRRLRVNEVDLLQVHNLRDTETQLAVARELRGEGKVRYVGVTHYLDRAHDELADVIEREKPDFVQINYSVISTGAEERIFPLAQEHGIAVLTNRNYDDGRLFSRVQGKALPGWATEVGAESWAQLFLKFALSHPAVTAVIPATGKPRHQRDNLGGGTGALLDDAQRAELVALFA